MGGAASMIANEEVAGALILRAKTFEGAPEDVKINDHTVRTYNLCITYCYDKNKYKQANKIKYTHVNAIESTQKKCSHF